MHLVIECPSCAEPNVDGSRFCNNCGASLRTHEGIQERRVVTALFADLARSTSLGEQLDPEVVRGIVGRFFELARREIERRGGTIEKFSGDAAMAVFGLPAAHEDDPERAVRAAVAIRDGLREVSEETEARQGVAVRARIGIEGGEVVVGDPFGGATMATGDALNVAARLEQLAEPGEIVVGPRTWEHVRDLVAGEPLGELAIRGRDAAAAAWRVDSIAEEVGRPRGVPGLEAPLTGRDEELALLLDAARRAARERKAVLFTILGVPGVGKSRIVREATTQLAAEGWSVLRGRCLPYGEGITYWPLAEMLRQVASITPGMSADEARARLAQVAPDAEVADRLGFALGLHDAGELLEAGVEREIAWAFRRLAEHRAAGSPHVLVFEDIHWAEPALLELIEYAATWARDVQLLIICPSRPELVDRRPGWGAGRMEAARISLEPLSEDESRSLLASLLAIDDLPAELRQRVLDRAEGNPLFVEEMVRMLIEEGVVERRDGRWVAGEGAASVRVPESVEALIRARLDTLPTGQRSVLQVASVVGRTFQQSAVAAIAPGQPGGQLEGHLEEAILRDLITEETAPDRDRLFRFRHVLIRDVAYGTLPKAQRADLHARVADWLREWAGERIDEFLEIRAYHLEQAALLRRELEGRLEPGERERAAAALAAAAGKALARDDAPAAERFAARALALEPEPGEAELEMRWMLLEALRRQDRLREAGELAEGVRREAAALGRRDLEGRAMLAAAGDIWTRLGSTESQAALAELERARQLLSEADDTTYLCHVLEWLGWGGWWLGELDESERWWTAERELAKAAAWPSREAEALLRLSGSRSVRGDVDGRRRLLQEAADLAERGSSRLTRAHVKRAQGSFLAMSISVERAEPLLREAALELHELGDSEHETALSYLGDIELRRGRPAEALELYRRGHGAVGEHAGRLPEVELRMARALLALGQLEEAARWAEHAVAVTGADDWATVASTRSTLGLVRESEGRLEEAESLLREAIAVNSRTDFNPWGLELAMAEFMLRAGRLIEGREWLARARASTERYGPQSPLIEWVERRGAAAQAAAGEA